MAVPSPTDRELVGRCLDGEAAAWSALVRRYADLVHGVARRTGLDGAAAADVVQETFLALWRSLRRLRDRERLFAWLVRTATRRAWREVRKGRAAARREKASARPERADEEPPEDVLASLEEEQAVREALVEVGERCRRLLSALYLDPEPSGYDEVARRLGLPRGSIGPTRSRCLERLRREMERRGFAPEGVSGRAASRGGRGVSEGGTSASSTVRSERT